MKDLKHTTKIELQEQLNQLQISLRAEQVRSSRLCSELNEQFKEKAELRRERDFCKALAGERFLKLQAIPSWVKTLFGGRS